MTEGVWPEVEGHHRAGSNNSSSSVITLSMLSVHHTSYQQLSASPAEGIRHVTEGLMRKVTIGQDLITAISEGHHQTGSDIAAVSQSSSCQISEIQAAAAAAATCTQVSPTHSTFNTHTQTHPFNGPFSRTTRVSRYQKGKTNLDFTEAKRQ